jgi:hypothetical protein
MRSGSVREPAAEPREPRCEMLTTPPPTTVSFRPVAAGGGTGDEEAATSLRWACCIDLPSVFWPVPEGMPRDIAEGVVWRHTLLPQRRLLAQALAEEACEEQPRAEVTRQIERMPADAVIDALDELARRTDPAALGLPAFGLLRPARGARACTTRMRLVVAVLARRRGEIFLRDADPLPLAWVAHPLDLWALEPEPAAPNAP